MWRERIKLTGLSVKNFEMPVCRPRMTQDEILKKGLESKVTDGQAAHSHAVWWAPMR